MLENYNFISRTGERVPDTLYHEISIPKEATYAKFRTGYAGVRFNVDVYNGCYIKFE